MPFERVMPRLRMAFMSPFAFALQRRPRHGVPMRVGVQVVFDVVYSCVVFWNVWLRFATIGDASSMLAVQMSLLSSIKPLFDTLRRNVPQQGLIALRTRLRSYHPLMQLAAAMNTEC